MRPEVLRTLAAYKKQEGIRLQATDSLLFFICAESVCMVQYFCMAGARRGRRQLRQTGSHV